MPPIPPLPPTATFDVIVLFETVIEPAALKMPPPSPVDPSRPAPPAPPTAPPPLPCTPVDPAVPCAVLLETTTDESVTFPPRFSSPAPSEASPPVIESFWIVTLPLRISNTRSSPLPLTIVLFALAPLMVIFPFTSRSPVASASSLAPGIVSVNVPAGTMIVLEP